MTASPCACSTSPCSERGWCNLLEDTRLMCMCRVFCTTQVRTPWWSSHRPSRDSCSEDCRALLLRLSWSIHPPSTPSLRACSTSDPYSERVVVQPSRRHSPDEPPPCFLHNPRPTALVEQPSTEHGSLQCVEQNPLALTLFGQPPTEHTFFFPPPPFFSTTTLIRALVRSDGARCKGQCR